MSLVLHLSDLHLGSVDDEDDVGDYSKSEMVSRDDRVSRHGLLKTALKALARWLEQHDEELAAVVISGDITTRGRSDGFKQLQPLLQALDSKLPKPSRILVVPGNHDVTWGTSPGSPKRYQPFVAGVRSLKYVTPLLDGIDYDGEDPKPSRNPIVLGEDFVLVAVNSADFCGVVEPLPKELDKSLQKLVAADHLTKAEYDRLATLQTYDMPRIQPRQMTALGELLATVDGEDSHRVRIAVLHHQLAPVREAEELKPFESIVNLGAFEAFLADSRTDLVLHGHKHVDQVRTVLLGERSHPRPVVVSSCGTIGKELGIGHEIAKLVRIDSSLPNLRTVEVLSVEAIGSGQISLKEKIKPIYRDRTWSPGADTRITVVDGTTASEVHEKLLALANDPAPPRRDVVCVIDDGSSASGPPTTYEGPADESDPLAEWFQETVAWWQDAAAGSKKSFTHGQRLHTWPGPGGSSSVDQISAIAETLGSDTTTSRGIAVLVNPALDDIRDKKQSFPSFSLLHFWIEDSKLHCSAFFRKQEMRYWWAVNVAEIAHIQAELVHRLHTTGNPGLTPGSIRTHTSGAVFSDQVPKVAVPRIDRLFRKSPDGVRALAVSVADKTAPQRATDLATLLHLLDDWEPEEEEPPADGAPVPGPGLSALADLLDELAPRYPESPAEAVADLLREIADLNDTYLDDRDGPDAREKYKKWRGKVRPKLAKVRALIAPVPTRRRRSPQAKKAAKSAGRTHG